jgi:hypothetical protein
MSIFLAFALLAAQVIDYDMNRQQQKETGVYKLTTKQKQALQEWIDAHYAKREEPLPIRGSSTNAVLSENLYNGHYIRLSDRSTWEINPEDTPLTQGWITPAEIIVSQSGDPNYPYKLTNSLTGSSVKAKKASNTPRS